MSRAALIISSAKYEDAELHDLPAADRDGEALAEVLSDPAIGNYETLRVTDSAYHSIGEATGSFFDGRSPDDELLLHLSGHALRSDDFELHFATRTTRVDRLEETSFAARLLARQINRCRAKRVTILLDCCFAGSFPLGAKSGNGSFAEQLLGGGRALIAATTSTKVAFVADDADNHGMSTFTYAVVEGLRTGVADRDGDGVVSPVDLFAHVRDRLRDSQPLQTPSLTASDLHGHWVIAQSPRGKVSDGAAPVDAAVPSPGIATAPRSLWHLLPTAIEKVDSLNDEDLAAHISTGLSTLDEVLGGYRAGQLVLVSGDSGVGKTNFLLTSAREAAIKRGTPVTLLSLELDANSIVNRILAAEAKVPIHFIEEGRMRVEDWEAFSKVVPSFESAPLTILDQASGRVPIDAVARLLGETDSKIVLIDDLHLLADSHVTATLVASVRQLAALARQQGVVIVAALDAELGRSQAQRASIERFADLTIAIRRPDQVDSHDRPGEADLLIHPRRPNAYAVPVSYQGHYSRFTDLSPSHRKATGPG